MSDGSIVREGSEIPVEKLNRDAWSWGCVLTIDSNGRTVWIVDAHRGERKRFIVRN
jgi:hypothetical protein